MKFVTKVRVVGLIVFIATFALPAGAQNIVKKLTPPCNDFTTTRSGVECVIRAQCGSNCKFVRAQLGITTLPQRCENPYSLRAYSTFKRSSVRVDVGGQGTLKTGSPWSLVGLDEDPCEGTHITAIPLPIGPC